MSFEIPMYTNYYSDLETISIYIFFKKYISKVQRLKSSDKIFANRREGEILQPLQMGALCHVEQLLRVQNVNSILPFV